MHLAPPRDEEEVYSSLRWLGGSPCEGLRVGAGWTRVRGEGAQNGVFEGVVNVGLCFGFPTGGRVINYRRGVAAGLRCSSTGIFFVDSARGRGGGAGVFEGREFNEADLSPTGYPNRRINGPGVVSKRFFPDLGYLRVVFRERMIVRG